MMQENARRRRKPKKYDHLAIAYSPVNQQWFVLWPGRGPIEQQQVLARYSSLDEAEKYADRISGRELSVNPRARTTRDEWTLQGHYGHGWEDLTAADTWKEIKQYRRDYELNEPGTPLRIIKRRVKIAPAQANPLSKKCQALVSRTAASEQRKGVPQKQAVAIGYSKARRAGCKVPAPRRLAENPTSFWGRYLG